jgi:Ca2+-binding RTX toxin-like protein
VATFNGTPGDDVFVGGPANDQAFGNEGNDQLSGGDGNDNLNGNNGDDILNGDNGNDTLSGGFGNDILQGGAGDDSLDGGQGVDMVYGGSGNDSLRVGPSGMNESGELADGGDGIDFLTFGVNFSITDIVFSIADPSVDQVVDGVTIRNIERVLFFAFDGNDTLTGGQYDDSFFGGFGNDVIHGGGGNDTIRGDNGQDQLFGDDGDDTLTLFGEDLLIDGGTGVDLAIIEFSGGGTPVTLDVSDPSVDQIVFGTTIRNVERLNYTGGDGVDHITGGDFVDLILGGGSNDILAGGGGNDTVSGGEGIDQLSGGAGDDFLHSYELADTAGDSLMDGGDGFDLLEFRIANYSGSTTIDLADSTGRIRNIEQINFSGGMGNNIVTGGGAGDTMRGNASADEFRGLGGNDILFGGGGDDLLYGGDGNDQIDGDAGANTIYGEGGNDRLGASGTEANFIDGGLGNDEITGGFGDDTLIGGEGNDYIDGNAGSDWMAGGVGNDIYLIDSVSDVASELDGQGIDEVRTFLASYTLGDTFENLSGNPFTSAPESGQTLTGNALDNVISGSYGNDTLVGGIGADIMSGRYGNDTFYVDSSNDLVLENEDQGRDVIYTSASYTLGAGVYVEALSTDSIAGTAAINLAGNSFNNEIYGNNGANLLNGGGGGDYLVGWGGDDTYLIFSGSEIIVEQVNGGRDVVYTSVSYRLAAGTQVEVLAASSIGDTTAINLTGNELNNEIYGNNGANLLNGGGGAGDYLVGWGGDDTYLIFTGGEIIVENVGGGRDVVYTTVSYGLAAGTQVEVLSTDSIAGTNAINLTGNELNNEIYGNNGANILNGGGGAGDYLVGWGGDDTYLIFTGGEIIIENVGGGRDVVYTTVSYGIAAGTQVEVLSTDSIAGTNAINLTGNELNNEIYGNNGANTLNGGGGAGDYLVGWGGDDTYLIFTGGEIIIENAGGGRDVVYSTVSYALAAGTSVEVLSTNSIGGTTGLSLTGNELGQEVYGNNGANTLNGGAGGDYLAGFGGADSFAFTTALGSGNVDHLADFSAVDDTILLENAVFTGLANGALAPGAFVAGSAAADADDRIVYNSATGQIFFDADGNGAGAQVLFATVNAGTILTASDFMVI